MDPSIVDPSKLPSTKAAYVSGIRVAKSILLNQGINVRAHGKEIILPCILINMEVVFEAYLRAILAEHLSAFTVLDGNLSEPSGAARALFDHPHPSVKGNRATPDVVICRSSAPPTTEFVIDAKYKPPGSQPDREDINQILVYSILYNCKRVALAYPRRKSTEPYIQRVGSVGGIEVLKVLVDLGSDNLANEEADLGSAVGTLLS
jgi:5-methylcytosine-specific restriction endonuclease McrBC regulatory subunit McrC